MITNALTNNSEFSLYQQKDNLELSAAECIFQEIKKSTGFPSCLLCSLPLLHAFLHRQEFWDLATDWSSASECPHLRLKQVLCNSVRSNPVVSIQGYSDTVTEALLESRKPHTLSMCVYSYIYMYLSKHMCKRTYTPSVYTAKACIHHLLLC